MHFTWRRQISPLQKKPINSLVKLCLNENVSDVAIVLAFADIRVTRKPFRSPTRRYELYSSITWIVLCFYFLRLVWFKWSAFLPRSCHFSFPHPCLLFVSPSLSPSLPLALSLFYPSTKVLIYRELILINKYPTQLEKNSL